MTEALLTITDLCWRVPEKTILKNITFDIHQGEVIGIIGPNGAGKTSLLHCMLNQQQDFIGNIYFQKENIKHYSAKILAQHFALVAQKSHAIFSLTVAEVVHMGLLPHKGLFSLPNESDAEHIANALEKVGLISVINQAFNLLSGGEQQRVLIARALVQKPQILILDEPTNHLDIYYQHQILQLVTSLGITVLMTVHDLNLASQYCQRLLLLNQGELIADNTPEKVLTPALLTPVFGLNCIIEQDHAINNNAVRVYFSTGVNQQGKTHD